MGKLTFDLDTVYDHQEGVEKGYNHVHPGKRSYHPLLSFIAVRIFREYAEDDLLGKVPVYEYHLWVTNLPLSANKLEQFYKMIC